MAQHSKKHQSIHELLEFQSKLKKLNDVVGMLSRASSFDEFCRLTIELGRRDLGFDRLGLWFLDSDPQYLVGSFGVDENGQVRDERKVRHETQADDEAWTMLQNDQLRSVIRNIPLRNDKTDIVGHGDFVRASLWDGERILGWLTADNLLSKKAWTNSQIELIGLYATTLGHLITRKRYEETLKKREETAREFQEKLKALHKITAELSKMHSFDELCRQVVELGRSKLGFERLSLWFLDEDSQYLVGSFGTDEQGQTRDERMERVPFDSTSDSQVQLGDHQDTARADVPLHNAKCEVVGRGWKAVAQLWDGEQNTGWLIADTLFSGKPLSANQLELLAIYANTVGPLAVARKSEERLAFERNLFRTAIDTVPDYIYVKDAEGRYLLINRTAWSDVPNCSSESELLGKTDFAVTSPDLAVQRQADDRTVMESGQSIVNLEEPGQSKTGEPVTLLTTKAPLRDASGHVIGIVGVSRDVTNLKRIEKEAVELTVTRERINVLRESITSISHDLRTPLTIINSCLYLLDRISDPENQKDKLDTIKNQIALLEQLIEEVLLSSHLEQGLIATRHSVNLNVVVDGLSRHFAETCANRGLIIKANLWPDLPPVLGDEVELERALFNLLQNATLYTPNGGSVTIQTRVQDDQALVEVIDTGPGISEQDLPHIFEHFFRADRARSVGKGNIGLGLAMVKRIIELHKGLVEVESVVGQGSTFRIKLPHP